MQIVKNVQYNCNSLSLLPISLEIRGQTTHVHVEEALRIGKKPTCLIKPIQK